MKSQEEIVNALHQKWPDIEVLDSYTGANNKMHFRCKNCGHTWSTTARSVIVSACGCPACGVKNAEKERTIAHLKYKLSDQFEFIEYKDSKHVSVKCKICGAIRTTTPNNLLKYGCKKCATKTMAQLKSFTTEEFIKKARALHGDTYDYSKVNYINYHTKVCIICKKHGEFWQTPAKHLSGQGCAKCLGKNSTFEEFLEKARAKHGNFYNYDKVDFVNLKTPVIVTCPIHGDFIIKPCNHINLGCGCHKCKESSGEKLVNSILTNLNITFTREVSILNPYNKNHNFRVDFYFIINKQKYIIEYNGPLHYKPVELMGGQLGFEIRQARDVDLKKYCQDNNIKLLEIKYNNKNVQQTIEQFINDVPSI